MRSSYFQNVLELLEKDPSINSYCFELNVSTRNIFVFHLLLQYIYVTSFRGKLEKHFSILYFIISTLLKLFSTYLKKNYFITGAIRPFLQEFNSRIGQMIFKTEIGNRHPHFHCVRTKFQKLK